VLQDSSQASQAKDFGKKFAAMCHWNDDQKKYFESLLLSTAVPGSSAVSISANDDKSMQ
jgi:hypothetical protein